MISKIYAFNKNNETRFRRLYRESPSDSEIRNAIYAAGNCNFTSISGQTIVYKNFGGIYVAIVSTDENEMYILNLINFIMSLIEKLIGGVSDASLVYNFKDCQILIDNMIVNGKVVNLDSQEILSSRYIMEY